MAEKNILLVDSSQAVQKVISRAFSKLDYELIVAENFNDADDFLRDEKPDLVMADVALPGKNGYELCEYLKSNPGTASIPVILIVGTDHTIDKKESLRVHADEYILRPFDSKGLLDKVGALLHESPPVLNSNAVLSDMNLTGNNNSKPDSREEISELEPLELLDAETLPDELVTDAPRQETIPVPDFTAASPDELPSILTGPEYDEEASEIPPLSKVKRRSTSSEDIILSQMGIGSDDEDETGVETATGLIGNKMETEALSEIVPSEKAAEASQLEKDSEESPSVIDASPAEEVVSWPTASAATDETSKLPDVDFASSAPVGVPRGEIERLVVDTVMEIVGPTANGLVKEAAIDAVSAIADEAVEASVEKAVSEHAALLVAKVAEEAVGAVIEKSVRVAAEKAIEGKVAKAVKEAAEKAVTAIAEEAVESAVTKAVEKVAVAASEKAATEAVDKIAVMAVEAIASDTVDKVVEEIVSKIASYSVHRSADEFMKKEAPAALAKAAVEAVSTGAEEAIIHVAAETVQKTVGTAVEKAAQDAVAKKAPAAIKKAATAEVKTTAAETVKKTAGGLIAISAEKAVSALAQAAVDKAASKVVGDKAGEAITKAAEEAASELTSKTVEKVAAEFVKTTAENIVKAELKKAFAK